MYVCKGELSNIECQTLHDDDEYGDMCLADFGALNYLQEKQTKESNAWKNGQLDEVITILRKEGELINLSRCIACCCLCEGKRNYPKDETGKKFFQLVLQAVPQLPNNQ